MFDIYRGGSPARIGPPIFGGNVEPCDDTDLKFVTTAIWVGHGGDLALWMRNCKADSPGDRVTILHNVPSGTWLPIRARRILKSGTSASGIVAFI